MMKSELMELMKVNELEESKYAALEQWYLAIDLDKEQFAQIVKAVGIDTLVENERRARVINRAVDEHEKRERYERNKIRLDELEQEAEILKCAIERYEKATNR